MNDFQNNLLGKSKPPYFMGLLGLFPFVGFFVGIGLTLYGIIRYKDRKLVLIGIACMLFTILTYSALFYLGNFSGMGKKAKEQHAQIQLNSLVKDIEYYRIQNGKYPDSLKQLEAQNEIVFLEDPTQSELDEHYYNYENLGKKYLLFSSGSDQIKNTIDDIFPLIKNAKNVGWTVNKGNNR